MKKLVVAASALMLTGAMVSTAAAEVSFSGDAYTRYYFVDNWGFNNDNDSDSWRSRVRLKMTGTTASGAKAVARFTMNSNRWGQDNNGRGNVAVDYAYIEVPIGCVTFTAGDWDFGSGLLGWHDSTNVEAAAITWANDATTVTGIYGIIDTGWSNSQDEDRIFGLVVSHNFENGWNVTFGGSFDTRDLSGPPLNSGDDNTGFTAQLGVSGALGPVNLAAELGYQQDGFTGNDETVVEATGDDGYGFFVSAGMDFDAAGVTLLAGMTQDGYAFDAPVGFIMIAGDSMLSPIGTIGSFDANLGGADDAMDTWFIGLQTTYQATEKLGLGFNIAYADMEGSDGGREEDLSTELLEISASLSYALADGVSVVSEIGYLDFDTESLADEDNVFGAVVSLNLTF